MKTAIKLALIYLAMQILGALAVGPFTMIYAYVKYGTVAVSYTHLDVYKRQAQLRVVNVVTNGANVLVHKTIF